MHKYFIKTPWIAKKVFSSYLWSLPADKKEVYLTFDDGPHPTITPWVLQQLNDFDAKATFFCIGNNVERYPETYQQILDEGHRTGNHTYHHLNGWKTKDERYLADIAKAAEIINSNLFRPPYGRVKNSQSKRIPDILQNTHSRIIMWDVLSADFDLSFSPEQCLNNVIENFASGSIIVFHDSEKAFRNLQYALPGTLEALNQLGFCFKTIEI
jgi:peptidoglycan/xylan/chitin deacetylase (PgdA/CDA1 family)